MEVINMEENIQDFENEEIDDSEEVLDDEDDLDDLEDDSEDDSEEELFKENPLKAIFYRLGEIKELIENG
jgi:hypothetical protein